MPNGTLATGRIREASNGDHCRPVNQWVAILENHSHKDIIGSNPHTGDREHVQTRVIFFVRKQWLVYIFI